MKGDSPTKNYEILERQKIFKNDIIEIRVLSNTII